ncbi:hypothetical protein [Kitasatospora sp. NPDC059803]|uniref:hypothetical protein n=1 Tax=Kitasatospora sp. NPDC059803 TaxID=3346953 RepID=UPI003662C293
MASRSTAIRSFVHQMAKTYDCAMDTDYYDHRRRWEIRWHDGPTEATVRAAVARQLPQHQEVIALCRDLSEEAIVLGAIRCYITGEVHQWNDLRYAAQRSLEDVAHPLRTATARESAMVERVLEESAQETRWGRDRDASYALALLKERRGIGWLLTPPVPAQDGRQPEADAPVPAALELSPVELLTARYALGEQGAAWRERAAAMPAAQAFDAALADEEIDKETALAALRLVAERQAALDAATVLLIGRARAAGGSWSDVGRALGGITKQSAAKKYQVLTDSTRAASANG